MKYLKYILAVLIVTIAPNVFAWDLSNKVEALPTFGKGTYSGQTATSPTAVVYNNIGTRYQGKLSVISFFLDTDDWDWNYGRTYTIELYMETNDWDNNFMYPQVYKAQQTGSTSGSNLSKSSVSFVSNKKIKFTFKTPDSDMFPYMFFRVYSSNYMTTGITRISNYNFNKVIIYENSSNGGSSGGSSGGSTPTPTSTPNSTEQIIDSSIHNTEDIINNNNQNTQDIIENNNNNTQEIINSNQSCQFVDKNKIASSGYLDNVGIIRDGGDQWGVTDYINIYNGKVKVTEPMYSGAYTCFYDSNKTIISCVSQANFELDTFLNLPQNSSYARFSIYKTSNIPTFEVCLNGNQATTDAINNLNDSINNDNIDNGLGGSFFSDFDDQDFGLSSIITIPLNTIQSLTSKSCVALNVPIPFTNSSVPLPCMTEVYQQNIPTIYNLWKIVSFGLIAYFIAIDIFHMVKGFKDPESDKVEVLDL